MISRSGNDLSGPSVEDSYGLVENPAFRSSDSDRQLRRRIMYRRRRITVGVATLAVLGVVYTLYTQSAPIPVADVTPAWITTPVGQLATVDVNTRAFAVGVVPSATVSNGESIPVIADEAAARAESGQAVLPKALVAGSNVIEKLPMASLAKVVTALVLVDSHPISAVDNGPTITYRATDVEIYRKQLAVGGSVAVVSDGLHLNLRQSLEAMLIPSANNYALSLAVWDSGSIEAFNVKAKAWLQREGLTDTVLTDPSGLDPASVSTAADLVRLGIYFHANPVLASIVSMATASIPGVGNVYNSNKVLGGGGVTGIKTGTLDNYANLLFSAERELPDTPPGSRSVQVTVIGVVLGSGSHDTLYAQVSEVLDKAFANFHRTLLLTPNTKVGSMKTAWGAESDVVVAATPEIVTWGATVIPNSANLKPVTEATRGSDAGSLIFELPETPTINVPLRFASDISPPDFWWRLTHPIR